MKKEQIPRWCRVCGRSETFGILDQLDHGEVHNILVCTRCGYLKLGSETVETLLREEEPKEDAKKP